MKAHITAQLLGYDLSGSLHLKGVLEDPKQLRERAQVYLEEYFQGMSDASPTLVFLEDIHWADDSSLDMVNHLAQNLPDQRLLLICLARHRLFDRRPHWGEGLGTHRRLELLPLSKHNSCQLVKEILVKADDVPEALGNLVVKGAEGNPFYIEELIKILIEDGVICTGPDQWRVELNRLAAIEIPGTLTGVLQARLECLPPEERTTLQQASVVGRIFWDDTVKYINNGAHSNDTQYAMSSTEENLSSLRSRELVYQHEESTFTDASEYIFKHAMLREVTYESVLRRLRRLYHGLVADWLIQHGGDRVAEYTGLIAEHLELAGLKDQTVLYLQLAGDQAVKQFANEEAIGYYQRALGLLAGRTQDDVISVEMIPELYQSIGDVQSAIGGHEQARQAFENAYTLIPPDDLLWRARIQRKIGRTWQDQGKVEESTRAFDVAEAMLEHKPAESPDSWWQEWLWIQINRMFGLYARAQSEEMADLLEKVQPIIEQYSTPQQHDAFYGSKILMIYRRDRYVTSEELLTVIRKHLSLALEVGDQRKIAEAQFQLGFALLWYGALDEAESALQQALKSAEGSSHLYYLTLCFTYLTIVYRKKGLVENTREYIKKSIAAATKRQMPGYIATAQANQAWIDWRAGDPDAAEKHARQALAGWKQVKFVSSFQWTALWPLMTVAVEKDQIEQAVQYAADLLAPEQQALPQTVTATLEQAIHAWQNNQLEVTRQQLAHALTLAEEINQL
jgi:predicted ATPase